MASVPLHHLLSPAKDLVFSKLQILAPGHPQVYVLRVSENNVFSGCVWMCIVCFENLQLLPIKVLA